MANRNFSIKQLMQMSACTNCRACEDICPAVSALRDGQLSAIYRMKGLHDILKSRTLTTYVRRKKVPLEVLDITQLIHRALKRSGVKQEPNERAV